MVRNNRSSYQQDLFGVSKSSALKERVRELDRLIKRALRKKNFESANEFIREQERIIRELVDIGDKEITNDGSGHHYDDG